uniref:Bax-1 n=1 Tax=Schmidtea mediterranea TaxID=79327 RepID=H2DL15_SCHMD|nr:bax-1 [Schmidtea mediterranea]
MGDYDTDDELKNDAHFDDSIPSMEAESICDRITNNSSNATPVNNGDDYSSSNSHRNHRHNPRCYTAEVFVKGISYVLKKKIKNCSPSNIPTERKYVNLLSVDDGFQEDNPSPLMSSICSDRDQGALSDASSEGFYCQNDYNHACNEGLCMHVTPFISKLKQNFFLPNNDQCALLPKFDDKFYKSLEHLIKYFEEKFNSDSSDWLRTNALQMNQMDKIQARQELNKIFLSIFSEKINWGRIVAMIGFVCELSSSAFMIHRHDLIEEYVYTSVSFVDEYLWSWIFQHGGWEGLMEFQTGQSGSNNELENIFSSLSRIARVAALALAGVAFCKYVADHI